MARLVFEKGDRVRHTGAGGTGPFVVRQVLVTDSGRCYDLAGYNRLVDEDDLEPWGMTEDLRRALRELRGGGHG